MTTRARWGLLGASCAALLAARAAAAPATVLFADRQVTIEDAVVDGDDLYVSPADLTRINGFELKPQGVCRDDFCVPIGRKPSDGFLRGEGAAQRFNVSKLARLLKQPVVADARRAIWSFGPLPAEAAGAIDPAAAVDFALPDRQGKLVRLSDFRGRKVLVLSWASW